MLPYEFELPRLGAAFAAGISREVLQGHGVRKRDARVDVKDIGQAERAELGRLLDSVHRPAVGTVEVQPELRRRVHPE